MKQRIINFLLRHYLTAIVVDDLITTDKIGNTIVVKLNGKELTKNELQQLHAEIKALEGFRIWGILTNSLKHIAQDKIFNKSLNFDDVMAGKMMLFNLGIQESVLKVLKNKA